MEVLMRNLFTVLALTVGVSLVAAQPNTYNVSCGVKKQKTQGGYSTSVLVKGKVTVGAKIATFDDYTVGYTVYSDSVGKEVWTQETITGRDLANDAKYAGTKYTNHVKFNLPSKKGTVALIVPKNLKHNLKFQSHVVFTSIDDHFGGSAHLFCSAKLAN
jgi:hypothetical protein